MFTAIKAQLDNIEARVKRENENTSQRIQLALALLKKAHAALPTNPVEADRHLAIAINYLEPS